MIDVRICKSTAVLRVQVESKGHAGTAPAGEDLVCAAVSALLYGYSKEIATMEDKHFTGRHVSAGERDGDAMIDVFCANERSYKRVMHHLAPIERGLELISQEHPDALKLSYLKED